MHTRSFIVLGYALLFSGCNDVVSTRRNLDHCTWKGGDGYCADRSPDMPYCVAGYGDCLAGGRYGCVAEVTPECHAPCGEPGDLSCVVGESSTGTSSMGTETSGSSESGSESSSTTGPMSCVNDEECTDAAAPFCGVSGECGTCEGTKDGDAACAGVDPGLPLCVGGACVQCTAAAPEACTGTTPLCDDATNTCVPCTEHGQCGEAACNLYTGACLPGDAEAIAHVGPGQEFASLTLAVASIPADAEGTVVVHQANYDEAVTVDGNRTVAFLAAEGDSPVWGLLAGGMPQLTVPMGSTVLVEGMQLSGNANDLGLRVDGGRAWVDRSRIVQNSGGGVLAEAGAELTLRNCFVGGSVNNVAALAVTGATATITYVTAGAGFGTATALTCDVAATVDTRNSLFVSEDAGGDEVQCPGATIEHSAAELDLGGTNVALGDMATTWFTAYGTGDFGLTAMHPVAIDTAAQWQTGDPTTDIDGDPRPAVDATPDYAGADVP